MCALQDLLGKGLLGNVKFILGKMYRYRFRIVHDVSVCVAIIKLHP